MALGRAFSISASGYGITFAKTNEIIGNEKTGGVPITRYAEAIEVELTQFDARRRMTSYKNMLFPTGTCAHLYTMQCLIFVVRLLLYHDYLHALITQKHKTRPFTDPGGSANGGQMAQCCLFT